MTPRCVRTRFVTIMILALFLIAWRGGYHGLGYRGYTYSPSPYTFVPNQMNGGYTLDQRTLSGGIQSWGMEGGLAAGTVLCVPPAPPKDQARFLASLPPQSIMPTPSYLPTTYTCVRFSE